MNRHKSDAWYSTLLLVSGVGIVLVLLSLGLQVAERRIGAWAILAVLGYLVFASAAVWRIFSDHANERRETLRREIDQLERDRWKALRDLEAEIRKANEIHQEHLRREDVMREEMFAKRLKEAEEDWISSKESDLDEEKEGLLGRIVKLWWALPESARQVDGFATCPVCVSKAIPILYGSPDAEGMAAAERGEAELSEYGLIRGSPEWACPECDFRWGRPLSGEDKIE